jgi:hypothetical protein
MDTWFRGMRLSKPRFWIDGKLSGSGWEEPEPGLPSQRRDYPESTFLRKLAARAIISETSLLISDILLEMGTA